MSRKQSYDADLSMSAPNNFSDKLANDLYASQKYQHYFDKFTMPTSV